MTNKKFKIKPVSVALIAVFGMAGAVSVPVLAETLANPIILAQSTNPCAAKNPCNPCAANPCAAKMKAADITRPAGTKAYEGDKNELLAYGAKLWEDKSLSASGALSCATCHAGYNTLSKSFELPYPHKISMVKAQIGVDLSVDAEQIVQFCMMAPMQAKAFAWDSKELAALSTFVVEFQKGYKAK